jgi:hypothetical protein
MDLLDRLAQAIERKMVSHFLFATIAHTHIGASRGGRFRHILATSVGLALNSRCCISLVMVNGLDLKAYEPFTIHAISPSMKTARVSNDTYQTAKLMCKNYTATACRPKSSQFTTMDGPISTFCQDEQGERSL